MPKQIVWLHDKALSINHPVFDVADVDGVLFIWDDAYFKRREYSLKRLVFIYETLCELPVEILYGKTIDVIATLQVEKVITPYTADTEVKSIIAELKESIEVEVVHDKPFVKIPDGYDFKRFFKYWNKAKKTALLSG